MVEKGAQQDLVVLDQSCRGSRGLGEVGDVEESEVGHRVELEVGPEVLDRVELGSVGREMDGAQGRAGGNEGFHLLGAMHLEAVPQHDSGSAELLEKDLEEGKHLRCADVAIGMEPEVELKMVSKRRDAQRGDGRDLLMGSSALPEHRRLSPRRPASANQRRHHEAAFVEEDQEGLQPRGVFFTRGQSCLTQA